jgi:hypothetical protein
MNAPITKINKEEAKEQNINTDKFAHYYPIYDMYFHSLREDNLNILEIGVKNGESLRLWKKYFPNAQIWGVDIDPKCLDHKEENIEILIGDQNDPTTFDPIKKIDFDIIIDDGSHVFFHMINSFEYLWKNLKNGGLYFIEDTGMIFHNHFLGFAQNRDKWDEFLVHQIRSLDLDTFSANLTEKRLEKDKNNRANFSHPIAQNVEKYLGVNVRKFRNEVLFFHHYCNLVVVKKKFDTEASAFDQIDSREKIIGNFK